MCSCVYDSITPYSQIPDAVVTGMPDSLGEQVVCAEVGEDLVLLSLSSRQPAQTRGVGILLRFRVKQYYFNVYFVKVKEKMRFEGFLSENGDIPVVIGRIPSMMSISYSQFLWSRIVKNQPV